MTDARLHALHWTFFSEVMDKKFADAYQMFSTWLQSVPPAQMSEIFDMGDELFDDESPYDDDSDDDDEEDTDIIDLDNLYTEEEIWDNSSA